MSIYIALHKQCNLPKVEKYIPIQVGAAHNPKLGYITDAEGDSISEKNPNYCELTALYYIWKNTDDPLVGLVHYRRFFYNKRLRADEKNIVKYDELCKITNDSNIILPQKHYFRVNNYDQYNKLHKKNDMDLCKRIVQEMTPEYSDSFEEVMNRKYIYPYNMFVMTRKNFDNYMEWLFSILFRMDNECDRSGYDAYNKRIFGFISERLLNVWVLKNKLNIVSYPVYNNTDNFGKHILEELENGIKKLM